MRLGPASPLLLLVLPLSVLLADPAHADFEIVAKQGDPVPGIASRTLGFAPANSANVPVIDETGTVWFSIGWGNSSGTAGLLRHDGTALTLFLQTDTPIPGLDVQARSVSNFAVAPAGLGGGVAINAGIGGYQRAILHLDGDGATLVARDGGPALDGDGLLDVNNATPSVDDHGRVAYVTRVVDSSGGANDGPELLLYDPFDDSRRLVIAAGDTVPSEDATYTTVGNERYFRVPEMNGNDQFVFRTGEGLFMDDEGVLREIVRFGQSIGGLGTVENITGSRINSDGDVAFRCRQRDGFDTTHVAYVRRGDTYVGLLSGAWVPDPDGDPFGTIRGFLPQPRLTDRSEIVITARTTERTGVFVYDGDNLANLARVGLPGPGGGVFTNGGWALCCTQQFTDNPHTANALGQVLFMSFEEMPGGETVAGLYLYQPAPASSVRRILAVGDSIQGHEVTELRPFDHGYNGAGAINNSGQITLRIGTDSGPAIVRYQTSVTDVPATAVGTRLDQNVPNPFNPHTTISYAIPRAGRVTLEIFDDRGRRVRTLLHETQPAGDHQVHWNGRDDAGRVVASGVYRYRLQGPGIMESRSMALLR